MSMQFEWDEEKRQEILRDRGIDIVRAALIFEEPEKLLIWEDDRFDYGETRFIAVGITEGIFYRLVFTIRNGAIRLITVWKVTEADVEKCKAGYVERNSKVEG